MSIFCFLFGIFFCLNVNSESQKIYIYIWKKHQESEQEIPLYIDMELDFQDQYLVVV